MPHICFHSPSGEADLFGIRISGWDGLSSDIAFAALQTDGVDNAEQLLRFANARHPVHERVAWGQHVLRAITYRVSCDPDAQDEPPLVQYAGRWINAPHLVLNTCHCARQRPGAVGGPCQRAVCDPRVGGRPESGVAR